MAARLALRLWKDESGATAIEYGLIVGLIFLVIIGGITTLMNSSDGMYAKIRTFVGGALN